MLLSKERPASSAAVGFAYAISSCQNRNQTPNSLEIFTPNAPAFAVGICGIAYNGVSQ